VLASDAVPSSRDSATPLGAPAEHPNQTDHGRGARDGEEAKKKNERIGNAMDVDWFGHVVATSSLPADRPSSEEPALSVIEAAIPAPFGSR